MSHDGKIIRARAFVSGRRQFFHIRNTCRLGRECGSINGVDPNV
ncbi:hypothetical protein J2T09_005180 [Neorhizobium huautlense]|uniref:Uncharacterized protein n=1 Tax=Neorhizobium huautlense TaxID=67774 RepID=A0ABT9Q257_9HYPH|nr:hypothetical protein [Neorhizobium huautlense]